MARSLEIGADLACHKDTTTNSVMTKTWKQKMGSFECSCMQTG